MSETTAIADVISLVFSERIFIVIRFRTFPDSSTAGDAQQGRIWFGRNCLKR